MKLKLALAQIVPSSSVPIMGISAQSSDEASHQSSQTPDIISPGSCPEHQSPLLGALEQASRTFHQSTNKSCAIDLVGSSSSVATIHFFSCQEADEKIFTKKTLHRLIY